MEQIMTGLHKGLNYWFLLVVNVVNPPPSRKWFYLIQIETKWKYTVQAITITKTDNSRHVVCVAFIFLEISYFDTFVLIYDNKPLYNL